MIHIERSTDYGLIRGIMTQGSIYRHLADDFSPTSAEFQPIKSDLIWYLLAWDGNELLGLWMLHPQNGICWEIHTALLPDAWGDRGLRAAKVALAWIWTHTPCRRIVTNVPDDNHLAFRFALAAGMTAYGVNRASFQKNGRLLDQACLGISRPLEMPLFEATEPAIASVGQGEG
jgi:RimJ/RimL family protein N-acetyltransferase